MMTRRRLLRWSLILVILAAVAVWLEPTRVVWGWLRGEAFYQGKPTSFWRGVIKRDLQTEPRLLLAKGLPPATWWDRCRQWIGEWFPETSSQRLITWDKEPIAVLQALAEDPNEKIAGFATDAMHYRLWAAQQSYWLEVIQKHR